MQARFEPIDLAALTADLASTFRSAMERAGLELRASSARRCPSRSTSIATCGRRSSSTCSRTRSSSRFEGEITRVGRGAAGGRAVLAVRDTGTGIPAHELPRLFERFHRVEGARARTHEGTGIGLALVQELVQAARRRARRSRARLGRGTHLHRLACRRHARTCRRADRAPAPRPDRRRRAAPTSRRRCAGCPTRRPGEPVSRQRRRPPPTRRSRSGRDPARRRQRRHARLRAPAAVGALDTSRRSATGARRSPRRGPARPT